MRFLAGQAHVEAGMRLKNNGQLEQALVEFQRAYSLDPGSAIAAQQIREVTEALDQKKKGQLAESPVEKARKGEPGDDRVPAAGARAEAGHQHHPPAQDEQPAAQGSL